MDSFNEALTKYRAGEAGEIKAFKFAILHLSHAVELLFKAHVADYHPLLVYKNPFTNKPLDKENTIGLWDAVQFLKNCGAPIDQDFYNDLEWLKSLRNSIEHSKFEMDVDEAKSVMGRLVEAIRNFHDHFKIELGTLVSDENRRLFNLLSNEYKRSLEKAQEEAARVSEDGEGHDCTWCGERRTASLIGASYVCKFCGQADTPVACVRCGLSELASRCELWSNDAGSPEYLCSSCQAHLQYLINTD